MALPKEPRQKMINLMYLVLTALLALNVSAEILNAFKTVNATLEVSSSLTEGKVKSIFRSFQDKMSDEKTKEKATYWYAKAAQAQKYADATYNYIQGLKSELLSQADFNPTYFTASLVFHSTVVYNPAMLVALLNHTNQAES